MQSGSKGWKKGSDQLSNNWDYFSKYWQWPTSKYQPTVNFLQTPAKAINPFLFPNSLKYLTKYLSLKWPNICVWSHQIFVFKVTKYLCLKWPNICAWSDPPLALLKALVASALESDNHNLSCEQPGYTYAPPTPELPQLIWVHALSRLPDKSIVKI